MTFTRVSMRKIREIFRLYLQAGLKYRSDRPQLQHHPRHRRQIFEVAKQTGLGWPLPKELADDETLIARLFPDSVSAPSRPGRTKPASAAVRTSMVQSSAAR